MRKSAFVFCLDLDRDPVAKHVYDALITEASVVETDDIIDDYPILQVVHDAQDVIHIVRTKDVLSHDYDRYASDINRLFGDHDYIGLVNWHQGANAPNAIFTVQTTGDMETGTFGRVDPKITRSLMRVIDQERVAAGLDRYRTWAEATHWSGVLYEASGTSVSKITPSIIDIEIGSSPEDWSDPAAAKVLARAILRSFDEYDESAQSLLCMGGVHFEAGFSLAVLSEMQAKPLAVSHILPNHWLVSEGYDQPERLEDLKSCVGSIAGGIDAVVFHDKLKSSYKQLARQLALDLGIPSFSHKKLKSPDTLPI